MMSLSSRLQVMQMDAHYDCNQGLSPYVLQVWIRALMRHGRAWPAAIPAAQALHLVPAS